jgi:hypothetical protein
LSVTAAEVGYLANIIRRGRVRNKAPFIDPKAWGLQGGVRKGRRNQAGRVEGGGTASMPMVKELGDILVVVHGEELSALWSTLHPQDTRPGSWN